MSSGSSRGEGAARRGGTGPLTEALLDADSSSGLGGCAAFLRLRGLDRVALRRLLGGLLEESSYSSAREKRSLNLEGSGRGMWEGVSGHPPTAAPCPDVTQGRDRLTSSCGLRHNWPGRAAAPAGWGFG